MAAFAGTEIKNAPCFTIEFKGKRVEFDMRGYLVDIDCWSKDLAAFLSSVDGITLMDDHWGVIRFVRWYYMTYGIAPMSGVIVKGLNRERESMIYSVRYLYQLFPRTPVRLACKYAGIPEPSGCT